MYSICAQFSKDHVTNFSPSKFEHKYKLFTCFFAVISTHDGTAGIIHCSCSSCCRGPGGAISAFYSAVLSFSGTTNFINNSTYGEGGAIWTSDNTVLSFSGNSSFINNSAAVGYGGAIYASNNTVLSFNGTNNFICNSAHWNGGAIYTINNITLSFSGTTNFINNSADNEGGAISAWINTLIAINRTSNFIYNSAHWNGGAICARDNVVLSFSAISHFINNSVEYSAGGAIYTYLNVVLSFSGTSRFINNSGSVGGAMYTHSSVHSLNATSIFLNNYAVHGGEIYADYNSTLAFSGTIYFTNNQAKIDTLSGYSTSGGGVYMEIHSTFSILPNTRVYWENNYATLGGAIYVRDASPMSYCTTVATLVPKEKCFFQLPGQNLSNSMAVKLIFKNNFADVAGSVLYGGAIDHCKLSHGLDSHSSGEVFDMIVYNNDSDYNTTSNISSDPFYMCSCKATIQTVV